LNLENMFTMTAEFRSSFSVIARGTLAHFLERYLNYPAITPEIDWQPFASVLVNDFLNG